MDETLQHTPLEPAHVALKARLVPFAGWLMPVQYTGITEEHLAVRSRVGIFDISHMGQLFVSGPGAEAWLNGLLTNNVARLAPGEGQYTLMLNETGGVIDDLIVYRMEPQHFFLVVNASRIAEDEAWLRRHLPESGVTLENQSAGWAGMAVQGPEAARLLENLPPRNGIRVGGSLIVCRTGYTGEDGFELFCPVDAAVGWWERFVAAGARPCGLGARDTLRLEMGYPLNGNDLSPTRTPVEAGLSFFVDFEKEFMGCGVLRAQKAAGGHDRLVAVRVTEKAPPPRAHYPVLAADGTPIGELASGGVAPSLGGAGIGMAYLPAAYAAVGTRLSIDVRGRPFPAEVVKKPFFRRTKRAES